MFFGLSGSWTALALWFFVLFTTVMTMCWKSNRQAERKSPTAATDDTAKSTSSRRANKPKEEQNQPLNKTNPDVALILEKTKKRDVETVAAILKSGKAIGDIGYGYIYGIKKQIISSNASWKQLIRRVSALSETGFDGKPVQAKNKKGQKVEFHMTLPDKLQKLMAPRKPGASDRQSSMSIVAKEDPKEVNLKDPNTKDPNPKEATPKDTNTKDPKDSNLKNVNPKEVASKESTIAKESNTKEKEPKK